MRGVQTYKVNYDKDGLSLTIGNSINNIRGCKLAYLYGTTLYVYCTRLYAYHLEKWPIFDVKNLPFPNVEVK